MAAGAISAALRSPAETGRRSSERYGKNPRRDGTIRTPRLVGKEGASGGQVFQKRRGSTFARLHEIESIHPGGLERIASDSTKTAGIGMPVTPMRRGQSTLESALADGRRKVSTQAPTCRRSTSVSAGSVAGAAGELARRTTSTTSCRSHSAVAMAPRTSSLRAQPAT